VTALGNYADSQSAVVVITLSLLQHWWSCEILHCFCQPPRYHHWPAGHITVSRHYCCYALNVL